MLIKKIPVDIVDPNTGYNANIDLPAMVLNTANKGKYSLATIRDFSGAETGVLINGRTRPEQQHVGKVFMFKLGGKSHDGGPRYSGFFNPGQELPKEVKGKTPPVKGGASAGGSQAPESRNRGFALSYAKDLVCSDIVPISSLGEITTLMLEFLDTGVWPKGRDVVPEEEVPEFDGNFAEDTFGDDSDDYGDSFDETPFG